MHATSRITGSIIQASASIGDGLGPLKAVACFGLLFLTLVIIGLIRGRGGKHRR